MTVASTRRNILANGFVAPCNAISSDAAAALPVPMHHRAQKSVIHVQSTAGATLPAARTVVTWLPAP